MRKKKIYLSQHGPLNRGLPIGAIEKVPSLYESNRLRHQIYEPGRDGFAYLP